MQVNKIDNQNFKAFNVESAYNTFFRRLNSPHRYTKFCELRRTQEQNPIEIIINAGEKKNLLATIVDEKGQVLYSAKEREYRGRFNFSPIKFLKNLCQVADSFNPKTEAALPQKSFLG